METTERKEESEGEEMQINNEWLIESDELNVTLKQRKISKPKDGEEKKEYWVVKGYYCSPQDALKAMVRKGIMGDGMNDLQAICNKLDELNKVIEGLSIQCGKEG